MPETISYAEVLSRHGFSFSKGLGQNFLIHPIVPARMAEGSGANADTFVLEVGPGAGILTRALAERAAKVTALEIDPRLLPVLEETLAGVSNAEVLLQDVLKADIPAIVAEHGEGRPAVAVANLPYYITSPALSRLIESHCFSSITVLVQKEVAHRLCAAPGAEDYGAFTVFVQYYGSPHTLFEVPAGCFHPRPKIDSAVFRLELYDTPPVPVRDEQFFFETVRAAFSMRRKTLRNCITGAFGGRMPKEEILAAFTDAEIDPRLRGECLGVPEFARLADALLAHMK